MNPRILRSCLPGAVVVGCAVVVSADPTVCFDNHTVNTCHQLPILTPPGPDNCVIAESNNSCQVGVEGCDLTQIGNPTTSTCRYSWGIFNEHDECVKVDGAPIQQSTVQCSPAVGDACGGGGGVEN